MRQKIFLLLLLVLGILAPNSFGASGGAEVDLSFKADIAFYGVEIERSFVEALALQPDGKILVGGAFLEVNGTPRQNMARLNKDGSLDLTFNPQGTTNQFVNAITCLEDGKILVLSSSGGAFSPHDSQALRLNSDGSLDPTFHSPILVGGAVELLAGNDSRIYLCGTLSSVDNFPRTYLARLHWNGHLDHDYTPPVQPHFSTEGGMVHMTQQADSKILLAGMFRLPDARGIFARFYTDGSVDNSFAGRGVYFCDDLEALPNGQIFHASSTQFGSEFAHLRVFETNGAIAAPFPDNNKVEGFIRATAFQGDGKILFGGQLMKRYTYSKHLARAFPDGTLDQRFDVGIGFARGVDTQRSPGVVNAIAVQPDGKILVGGLFSLYDGQPRMNLVRLSGERVLHREAKVGNNGTITFTWEILPSETEWQIQSSPDLKIWKVEQDDLNARVVQVIRQLENSELYFRIIPK
ncbi:MAG: hypothetical protein ACO1QB_03165 [Verrucomicrobiales bacterium]